MKFSKMVASSLIATSLVAAPLAAQAAAPAARLGSDVKGEELRGGFIIPLIALVAIILGILAATSGDDEDLPHSP